MSEETPNPETAKPRRRAATRMPTRQAASKVKCTIHLTLEASQRLDIHATMMGLDRSALVEKLIHEQLRRWVVSDRGKGGDSAPEEAA